MTPALFEHAGVRPFEIRSDVMHPTLRSGDYLMVRPVDRYDYDGIYILDSFNSGVGTPYRAERVIGSETAQVRVWHDNPLYSRQTIGLDEFNEIVVGKAVAEVRMKVTREELMRLAA